MRASKPKTDTMAPLPQAIQNLFGVGEVASFALAANVNAKSNVQQLSTHDLLLVNQWLGTVFAVVEHERRRRLP